jgi:hypothetical protein
MEVEHKSGPGWGQVNYNTVSGSAGLLALIDRFFGGGNCGNGGILGGLLGGGCKGNGAMDMAAIVAMLTALKDAGGGSSPAVNRYEAGMQARISELETEVKLRDANIYTDGKLGALRDYVDAKFAAVNDKLCVQAVHNATSDAMLGCLKGQVDAIYGLTKLVVPNSSVCPGWGSVTVAPATTPTTTG